MYDGLKLVVLTNGFVYIGVVLQRSEGLLVSSAKNIRVWGTTKGLGQLALNGPTKDTILDEVGELFAPMHAVIHVITTDPEKWR